MKKIFGISVQIAGVLIGAYVASPGDLTLSSFIGAGVGYLVAVFILAAYVLCRFLFTFQGTKK